ncbi:hypothetical protein ACIRVF_24445 [Kitasatospora sp. NPDC101157]|uniref:hypothetical protein n=1 Tax=Kitasatospora sp. NPDC101157 TaxID=3364098 RepID=UPI0037F603D0
MASAPDQASAALAGTGTTVLTAGAISGTLLALGGLTSALSRRRRRHGRTGRNR